MLLLNVTLEQGAYELQKQQTLAKAADAYAAAVAVAAPRLTTWAASSCARHLNTKTATSCRPA